MLQRYNHTVQKLLDNSVDPEGLKVMFLNNSASFDATHTTVDQVTNSGGYEVYGNGWPQGGEDITASVNIVDTNGAALAAAEIAVTATGGTIGPIYHALVYYGTIPLWMETPDDPQSAGDGTDMRIPFANGILFQVLDEPEE